MESWSSNMWSVFANYINGKLSIVVYNMISARKTWASLPVDKKEKSEKNQRWCVSMALSFPDIKKIVLNERETKEMVFLSWIQSSFVFKLTRNHAQIMIRKWFFKIYFFFRSCWHESLSTYEYVVVGIICFRVTSSF